MIAHHLEGALVIELVGSVERLAVLLHELFEALDVLELLEEVGELAGGLIVFERVVLERGDRVGESVRHLVEKRLFGCEIGIVGLALGQRVAFEIEKLVELPAHLVERMAHVEVAVVLAHAVPDLLEDLVEPRNAHPGKVGALTHEPLERLADVVGVREVLAELAEDLVGIEPQPLAPVPTGIADREHGQLLYTVRPPARSLFSLRCTWRPSRMSSLAAAISAGLSNGPTAMMASRRPGMPRIPSR